jgi:putative transcriptional regulator
MSKAGRRIIESAEQALAFSKGKAPKASAFRVHVPARLDVRALRRRVGMTQSAFAACFGVELRTIQDWEQGRRAPSGPARAFLAVIAREPDAVRRALAG